MSKPINILVTGCGGDIGQSIGKILKSESLFHKVIGCDMSSDNAAKFIFDKCLKVPACKAENYFSLIENIIREEQIDVVLPIAEPELRFYTEKKITGSIAGKPLIAANLKAMEIGFDKLLTSLFLEQSGLPFPKTQILGEVNNPELPLLIKSRSGSGSKAMFMLKDEQDFTYFKSKYPTYIAQEPVGTDDEEYTCGVFRSAKGETRTLSYRRKLLGGFSGFGTVVANKEIDQLLFDIAEKLELHGSINVQLRLTERGPVVFEINPRFSSTVTFRHLMGFKDVVWSIEDRLGLPISDYIPPATGKNFYKGFHEYID